MNTPPVGPASPSPSPKPTPTAQTPSVMRRIGNAVKAPFAALGQWFSRPSPNKVNDSLERASDDLEDDDEELSDIEANFLRNTSSTQNRTRSGNSLIPSPTESGRSSSASTTSAGSRSSSPTPSDISSIDDDDALKAAQKAREEDEIRTLSTIANVQMTFTMEVNGKKVAITPEILKQLQPIFEELAKTQEGDKLSKGFALVINLDKLSDIHFYQNQKEILGDTCAAFFQNHPHLLEHMKHIKTAIKISENLNLPSSTNKKPKASLKLQATPSADSNYIHKVRPDGDCLLEAALFHIKKMGQDKAALTAAQIRREMATKIRNEDLLSDKGLILQDILDARRHARENNIFQDAPHSYLFSEDQNGLNFICKENDTGPEPEVDLSKQQWDILLNAYARYIEHNIGTSDTRPSLGGYALEYLNQTYFQEKPLLVVTENGENDSFKGDREVDADDKQSTPVILYNGTNHYDAIDSSKEEFWKKYKCTKQP